MRRRGTGCVIAVTTVLLLIIVAVLVVRTIWKSLYPYGARPCCLPCMNMALLSYAQDNGEWFPAGGANPWESLRKVETYPDLLAGITGGRRALLERLQSGNMLDASVSSWVYFPGFREGDPVAIIWEREPGITFNGHVAEEGSHAVGFADSHWHQVSGTEWSKFLANQERMREAIQVYRSENPEIGPLPRSVQKEILEEVLTETNEK